MTLNNKYRENASVEVAENIPGFDVIMVGHDHKQYCKWIKNIAGQNVLIINPGKGAFNVSNVDIKIVRGKNGRIVDKQINGELVSLDNIAPDTEFLSEFKAQKDTLQKFVSHKLCVLDKDLSIRPAFFGPSDFIDAIHSIQLNLTGADISFAAPFSMNATLKKGDFSVGDLFNFYKYENKLYVIKMTGKEIKDYLEASYNGWINKMNKPSDHLLLLTEHNGTTTLKNELFNFDSAAGIFYTVDVTKDKGKRINIMKMADGEPFFSNKTYQVVLNSYRGNGGGGLLTAAGISESEQKQRIIYRSNNDMRSYIMTYLEQHGTDVFHALNQWEFIPSAWTKAAAQRDKALLFGNNDIREQH
jgi:2',3'-cyclic-nucleotide 2'-phosphodiesterase/3'-nucleotidase